MNDGLRQLDAEVAEKVFGLTVKVCKKVDFHYGYATEDPSYCGTCGKENVWTNEPHHVIYAEQPPMQSWPGSDGLLFNSPIQHYSSDPAACAIVKKHLLANGVCFAIYCGTADAFNVVAITFLEFKKGESPRGKGATEEEAICRFALACRAAGLLEAEVAV